jgi:hypothetical protein
VYGAGVSVAAGLLLRAQRGLDLFGNTFQRLADGLVNELFENAFRVGHRGFGCDQQRAAKIAPSTSTQRRVRTI